LSDSTPPAVAVYVDISKTGAVAILGGLIAFTSVIDGSLVHEQKTAIKDKKKKAIWKKRRFILK
jgi:hypothetical protein